MRVIRELIPGDEQELQSLIESVPSYAERVTGYPPGAADALSALISVPDDLGEARKTGAGLWEGGELAAFADVLLGYPTNATAYIGVILVRGDLQRRGLGTCLHGAVVDLVREETDACVLRIGLIHTIAHEAEPFVRALGYVPTGEVQPYRYDHVESERVMWELALG